jgi:subtilisin family serine protease
MTQSASPSPWPLQDRRSPEQIEADRAAVRTQSDRLRQQNLQDVYQRIVARVPEARNDDGVPCVLLEQPNGPVLVASTTLVVSSGDPRIEGYEPPDEPDQPVQSMRRMRCRSGREAESLVADVQGLRDEKITANVNPIMPLGYVIKGDVLPGKTTVTDAAPPVTEIDPGVRVAIIDTGRAEEDRLDGWSEGVTAVAFDQLDVVNPEGRNDYFAGHGTFTAGVVRQLSPSCEIYVYRFTHNDGMGTDTGAARAMLQAVEDAGTDRRLIINASFGAPAVDGEPPLAITEAVRHITTEHPDVLIVASAGNDGATQELYPAAFDEVKAVGAVDADLEPADFSNRGCWVDCSAVGVGVVSTFVPGVVPPEPTDGMDDVEFGPDAWATWSGTSFTAPQVSGAVAHLCTQDAGLSPRVAFDQLVAGGLDREDGLGVVVHLLPGTPT